ncbi:MAG TPA: MgtC/SapB family protein [Saprospiraceae bacterium]|nr:MgtC/SapB family protein [Saprospiraceae bacterium]
MDSYIINTPEFHLTQIEFLIRLLVACGIGFLIGLEREHSALAKKEEEFAGIRTFIFLSLLGFIGGLMHYLLSPWLFIVILASVIILTSMSYWVLAARGDIGGTSEFTTIIVVLLGALTFLGYIEVSLMITVIIVVLLSIKLKLQSVIGQITKEEMYDFIRFVVVALLIFPFLPNQTYGPYNAINPHEIGWVVLLTSGLGFIGYVLMRVLGADKGILFSGIIGGLISSTAVTWVFSRKSKEQPELSLNCATAILAASSIMVIRVLLWIILFNKELLSSFALPLGIVFLGAIGVTLYFYMQEKKSKAPHAEMLPGNPLNLRGALIFGLIYTIIILAVAYASNTFGNSGIYFTSGIGGLSDIDAITISVTKLSKEGISFLTAENAILIATIANTIVKVGIALWAGSKEIRRYIFIGYGVIFLAAVIAFVVLNL